LEFEVEEVEVEVELEVEVGFEFEFEFVFEFELGLEFWFEFGTGCDNTTFLDFNIYNDLFVVCFYSEKKNAEKKKWKERNKEKTYMG